MRIFIDADEIWPAYSVVLEEEYKEVFESWMGDWDEKSIEVPDKVVMELSKVLSDWNSAQRQLKELNEKRLSEGNPVSK